MVHGNIGTGKGSKQACHCNQIKKVLYDAVHIAGRKRKRGFVGIFCLEHVKDVI